MGRAEELPSARDLSHGTARAQDAVDFLVCPSAGNCSVVGSYGWGLNINNGGEEVFVGGEANGGWAHVRVPAGIAALNTGQFARASPACPARQWPTAPRAATT